MQKRVFDIVISILALILGAPLLLFSVLAIFLTSRGPIFYSCPRVGKHGEIFRCWKLRTMITDAEDLLPILLATDTALRQEWHTFYKLKEDPRITKIGRWLRKTSLDEFPQFWNVLCGKMSVVGPRPLSPEEVMRHVEGAAPKILQMPPGITGLWAASGRSEIPYPERIFLEEQYIDQQTFSLDLWIVIKTAVSVIRCRGAC